MGTLRAPSASKQAKRMGLGFLSCILANKDSGAAGILRRDGFGLKVGLGGGRGHLFCVALAKLWRMRMRDDSVQLSLLSQVRIRANQPLRVLQAGFIGQ